MRHVASGGTGATALGFIQHQAADTGNDGSVTAFDATQILGYVAVDGANPNTGRIGIWKFLLPSFNTSVKASTCTFSSVNF